MNYSVQNGATTFKFEGELLASSSSQMPHKPRWVEFQLYRTSSGTYILSRIGMSLLFHEKDCKTVSRNNLKKVEEAEIPPDATPCEVCAPARGVNAELYPETHRYFALRTTTAKGVLAGLLQYDDNNSEYLTNVAKTLLLAAAEVDNSIASVFFERFIE